MNPKISFTKKDFVVVIACAAFLIVNIGAIGSTGRQQAKESVCLSNLKQWGLAFQMWLNDHDGNFMDGKNKWFHALAPYYGAQLRNNEIRREYKIRFCPTAVEFEDEGAPAAFRAWKNLAAGGGSPLEPWMSYYWDGSYGTNSWIYYQASSTGQNAYFWKNANVKNPNEIPVLLDSYSFGGRARHDDPPPEFDGDVINAARDGYFTKQFCINRHNGSVNAVFMDFSARPVGLKELWTLRWSRTYNTCYKYTMCGNNGKPSTKFPDWMKGFKDY